MRDPLESDRLDACKQVMKAVKRNDLGQFMAGVRRLDNLVSSLRLGQNLDYLVHILARSPDNFNLLRWLISIECMPYLDLQATNLLE